MAANFVDVKNSLAPAAGRVDLETSPLLSGFPSSPESSESSNSSSASSDTELESSKGPQVAQKKDVAMVLSLLMTGVFIANADGSLVIATAGTIASHFSHLENASWLLTGFILSASAVQPIVAKLSDIFGRKSVLLACYAIFAAGNLIAGLGQSMWVVIAGRIVAGVGGAGNVIVSILITDLVPKLEVAPWRSYVNVVATIGRGLGGPLGGWLADTVGWRWSFIGQVPLTGIAFILVAYKLVDTSKFDHRKASHEVRSKLGRIDFLGAFLIASSIISFMFSIEMTSRGFSWISPLVLILLAVSALLGVLFFVWEEKYATEPIFPPRLLLQRNVGASYTISALQVAAQLALMFSVPLYFQVSLGMSNAAAGSHLVPAVIGNTFGGLVTGFVIKKTGRYKGLLFLAGASACSCYITLILFWNGHTNLSGSLAIFPGGFGTGITGAVTFISLTAYIPHTDVAVASGGYYLATSIGTVLGLSISSSVQRVGLKRLLERGGVDEYVVKHVLKDVSYVRGLKGALKETVTKSYVESLSYSHEFSLICSALALLLSFAVSEGGLV